MSDGVLRKVASDLAAVERSLDDIPARFGSDITSFEAGKALLEDRGPAADALQFSPEKCRNTA